MIYWSKHFQKTGTDPSKSPWEYCTVYFDETGRVLHTTRAKPESPLLRPFCLVYEGLVLAVFSTWDEALVQKESEPKSAVIHYAVEHGAVTTYEGA